MSTIMAEWEVMVLDELVVGTVRNYFNSIWDRDYGLSDVDALDAGCMAGRMFADVTDWDEVDCLDRGLDIAFEVMAEVKSNRREIS